jgi:anaerobic magnesium-protoporphyrin IX monomethyl ester cyclase
MPARDLMGLDKYNIFLDGKKATTLISSRGCPFNCSFCSSSMFGGLKWRNRTPESLVHEIAHLRATYGYEGFFFLDDNFTLEPKRVLRFCDMIIDRHPGIAMWCFSRVDTVMKNEDMVKKMAEAGMHQIFLGIESGNQETLDAWGKNVQLDYVQKACGLLKKYRIGVWGGFIIGDVDEKRSMIENTIRFAKKLNPEDAQFSILTPYPGTRLYDEVTDRLLTRNWDLFDGAHAVVQNRYLSTAQIQRLFVKAYLSFYLRLKKARKIIRYIARGSLSIRNILISWGSIRRVQKEVQSRDNDGKYQRGTRVRTAEVKAVKERGETKKTA